MIIIHIFRNEFILTQNHWDVIEGLVYRDADKVILKSKHGEKKKQEQQEQN